MHQQHSVTKSVTSVLIGIAIDQQLIRGVDEKISAFFPEYADIFAESAKDTLRLRHFLSMSSALSWDEWTYPYTDARNDHISLNRSKDPIRYALERPFVGAPGTQFVTTVALLSRWVRSSTKSRGCAPTNLPSGIFLRHSASQTTIGGNIPTARSRREEVSLCSRATWQKLVRSCYVAVAGKVSKL
jgi:Beta-lactamase